MIKLFHRTIALAALVAILSAGSIAYAAPIRDSISRHLYSECGFFAQNTGQRSHYVNQGYHVRTPYGR